MVACEIDERRWKHVFAGRSWFRASQGFKKKQNAGALLGAKKKNPQNNAGALSQATGASRGEAA